MDKMEIRLLNADEIECRVGSVSEKGVSLLLYKNARADMKVLDETFGPMGWKRTHQSINGSLYCTVVQAGCRDGELYGKGERAGFGQF